MMSRQLRDRQRRHRGERGHVRRDAAAPLRAVALRARELDERVRARRDGRTDRGRDATHVEAVEVPPPCRCVWPIAQPANPAANISPMVTEDECRFRGDGRDRRAGARRTIISGTAAGCLNPPVPRVPLLAGTRLVIAIGARRRARPAAAAARARRSPTSAQPCATRSASRSTESRSRRSPDGATRATIVVEPPALPIPGSPSDPRQLAIGAVVDELERLGIPSGYQTILVACGLARRTSQRELEALVTPRARATVPRQRRSSTTSRTRSCVRLDDDVAPAAAREPRRSSRPISS